MITALATGIAGDIVKDYFKDKIISKWSNYRAQKFLHSLLEELKIEMDSLNETNRLDVALSKLIKNEAGEELLFEAYRKVCLSASKDLGPRIIGIMTAQLLNEDRIATNEEECILSLAEQMSDIELLEFCAFYKKNLKDKPIVGCYEYDLHQEHRDSRWKSTRTSVSSTSSVSSLGLWAGKLEKVGFLYPNTSVEEFDRREGSEKHTNQIYYFSVIFDEGVIPLYEIARRAQGPQQGN